MSIVLGVGMGFIQGMLSVVRNDTAFQLMMGSHAALIGGMVSCILIPILYFSMIRRTLTLRALIEMCGIIILFGLAAALILGLYTEAGWLSWIITVALTIFASLLYCLGGVRIFAD